MGKLFVVAVLVICFAAPARADQFANDPIEQFVVYAGDALFARPAILGVTVVGAAVYAVTLPFTYFSRDSSAFDVLVRGPAEATFTRCLGCEIRGRKRSALSAATH
jgi:hypothetical protein